MGTPCTTPEVDDSAAALGDESVNITLNNLSGPPADSGSYIFLLGFKGAFRWGMFRKYDPALHLQPGLLSMEIIMV